MVHRPAPSVLSVTLLSLAVALLPLPLGAGDDPPATPRKRKPCPSIAFFASLPVVEVSIHVEASRVEQLEREPRVYVRATVTEGDRVYTDVGLHLKGRAGSFRPFHSRPALTLNFDKFHRKQRFHGMDKLHLNNSVQDSSYLCELICGDLFRQAGVPAPRVAHARVHLNGRDLGLYVLKEGFDRRFLRHHFEKTDGNLYDGGFLQEIDWGLEKKSGSGVDDRSDLEALAATCRIADLGKRERELDRVLDVSRFLTFLALEAMTHHWDGYSMKCNNYKIYHDPGSGKMVFLPHGMDQMFERTHTPLLPSWYRGLVAGAVMEIPRFRARYYDEAERLLEVVLLPRKITERIDRVQSRLDPVLERLGESRVRRQENHADYLRSSIVERIRNLKQQLGNLSKTREELAARLSGSDPEERNETGTRSGEGGEEFSPGARGR